MVKGKGRIAILLLLVVTVALPVNASGPNKEHANVPAAVAASCILMAPSIPGGALRGQQAVNAFLASPASSNALPGSVMWHCKLTLSLSGRDLSGMTIAETSADKADFSFIKGRKLHLNAVDFPGANFRNSDLTGATIRGPKADLSEADMQGAVLDGATIENVDMKGANLDAASLDGTHFAPHELPDLTYLAHATHLESMRSPGEPEALNKLHKELLDMGLTNRARDVTLAIHRSAEDLHKEVCSTGKDTGDRRLKHPLTDRLANCFLFAVPKLALDETCQFGRKPWRPLGIIAVLAASWTVVLTLATGWLRSSAISLVTKRKGSDVLVNFTRLTCRGSQNRGHLRMRFKIAAGLVIASIFNLPFEQVDVGRWLRLLSRREFDYRTRGWVRTFCGSLSLLCFYLLVLWIISIFFGEPFSGAA